MISTSEMPTASRRCIGAPGAAARLCVKMLLAENADCAVQDDDGRTALHWAVIQTRDDAVLNILATHCRQDEAIFKAIFEAKDVLGLTALHLAVRLAEWRGNRGASAIAILLRNGAVLNTLNYAGKTPEDDALVIGNGLILQVLQDPDTYTFADQSAADGNAGQTSGYEVARLRPQPTWEFIRLMVSNFMWDYGTSNWRISWVTWVRHIPRPTHFSNI